MILYIYPKCSTCKRAVKFLEDRGIEVEVRNMILDKLTSKELKKYIKLSGKEIGKFFNTSGMKYRELGLKDKLSQMSDNERVELLASDGMLVKRPMLVGDNFVLNGFREKEWKEKLMTE